MFYYIFLLALAYFLYVKIFKMYYSYYYYTSQGIPCIGFPLPLFGNLLLYIKKSKEVTVYSKIVFEEVWDDIFGKELPPIMLEFIGSSPNLIFTHYKAVNQIIGPLNKFVDKDPKLPRIFKKILGNCIAMETSSDKALQTRKVLSVAFYKDKLNLMLQRVIEVTCDKLQDWKESLIDKDKVVNILDEIVDITNLNIQNVLLGPEGASKMIRYLENGKVKEDRFSDYIRSAGRTAFSRAVHPLRAFFDSLDGFDLGPREIEEGKNWITLRQFYLEQVKRIEQEMKNKDYVANNFISILLQNEYYSENFERIVDEIAIFVIGATLTTTLLIANTIYYLTLNKKYLTQIRQEIQQISGLPDFKQLSLSDLRQFLETNKFEEIKTLQNCLQETLRIAPSGRAFAHMTFNQDVEIIGKKIRAFDRIQIFADSLFRDEEQWQEPDRFIPERFDPLSPYYLTPSGKKREPASFIPFFGGRRICIGKTFAEQSARITLTIILSQIDFEIADDELFKRKPTTNPGFDLNPTINMKFKSIQ